MPKVQLEDGRSLHFAEYGQGPAVVLLHPIGLSGACWPALAELLAARHRVLAPDLAGHGGTRRPAGRYSIAGLADDVAELVRAADAGPVAAVGLSMGGMVALALAERHPSAVSAAVVINSAARIPDAIGPAVRGRADRARTEGMAALAEETLARWFTPGFPERQPETVAETRRQLLAGDAGVHADAWLALAEADFESGLGSLTRPLLVVTGSLDQSVTAQTGARTAGLAPHGRHVDLDGAGHMSPLEDPARLAAEILAFLDEGSTP